VAACTLIAVLVSAGSLGWGLRDRAARRATAEQEVRLALAEALALQRQGKWPEALAEAKHARALLPEGGEDALRQRVEEMLAGLGLVARLEKVRLSQPENWGEPLVAQEVSAEYAQVFREDGIDVEALSAEEAAARLPGRGVAAELAAALDDWAEVCRRAREPDSKWQHLLAVARAADPDEWRNRFRDARVQPEPRTALEKLARDGRVLSLRPPHLVLLAKALREAGAVEEAVALLRQAHR
jgi:hypothetical protein